MVGLVGLGLGVVGLGLGVGVVGSSWEKKLCWHQKQQKRGGGVGLDLWEERGVWSSSPMFGLIFDVE